MAADFVTNQEIIIQARRKLSQYAWHYLTGGAESETTMCQNRYALDSVAFRARVLVDVSNVDTSTTFLGHRLRIPVLLAPIGSLQIMTPEGAVAVARAAQEFGAIPASVLRDYIKALSAGTLARTRSTRSGPAFCRA